MNKNLKKIISTLGLTALCATSAFAATTYSKQTVYPPALGGRANSKYETKAVTGKAGNVMNPTVGGGYTVAATMFGNGSVGSSKSVSTQTGTLSIPSTSKQSAGKTSYLLFKNNYSTTVKVAVTGQMRTN